MRCTIVSSGRQLALERAVASLGTFKSYIAELQWHPDLHKPGSDTTAKGEVLKDFIAAVDAAKARPHTRDKPDHR